MFSFRGAFTFFLSTYLPSLFVVDFSSYLYDILKSLSKNLFFASIKTSQIFKRPRAVVTTPCDKICSPVMIIYKKHQLTTWAMKQDFRLKDVIAKSWFWLGEQKFEVPAPKWRRSGWAKSQTEHALFKFKLFTAQKYIQDLHFVTANEQ